MVPAHWLLSLSSGQGHVKRCVQRRLWAQEDLGSQSAGGWGLCSWLLIGKIPWRRGSLSLSLDVWLKYPSTGTYGLLGGARSWCQNGRLQNTSHNDNECSVVSLSQVSLFL